jgi:hypothetical protein
MMLYATGVVIFATLIIALYGVVCAVAARPLWAFIVDGVLALVPSIDAHVLEYPFWSQMIVYYLTLAVLRYADGRASKKWLRTGIKIAIIGGAELLVSFGAAEVCNADLTSCHKWVLGISGRYVLAGVISVVSLCLLTRLLLYLRHVGRFGAYMRAKKQGMTDEQARAYVAATHHVFKEDYAYEAIKREKAQKTDW